MTLAIIIVGIFAFANFLVFGVLLAFAVQFTRMQNRVDELTDAVEDSIEDATDMWEHIAENTARLNTQEKWAESVTELNGAIVARLNGDDN